MGKCSLDQKSTGPCRKPRFQMMTGITLDLGPVSTVLKASGSMATFLAKSGTCLVRYYHRGY
jgi:hypothetical protein